ncbi:MAG: hypothetical protein KBF92_02210 [Bacteroidia bacterium]|jgi:hypothetical protein|nr:hypothetical protein [Bacteroidota bacterium]MBK7431498.1 hypothetical protein [Bacteroidota bacterium]MBK7572036.1 hypothetical protein [Bacteroidota bacterium]MBK8587058.1 hypothetical protein [Bacteroidota bacterium]MBP9922619.1 hypothetical protein [Bacteroidia bacterium]
MSKKCYRCGKDATSKEHAPAKCYFPEEAEYRKNLITVPSCKEHNEDTSKDDEYVRNWICMSLGNNGTAYKQFFGKVIKSIQESPGLKAIMFKNAKRVFVEDEKGNKLPTWAFELDRVRFDSAIIKIAYALFYNTYKETWHKDLHTMTDFLVYGDMTQDEQGALLQSFRGQIHEHHFDGNNPQVFKYKFLQTESEDIHEQVLRMQFYEGFEIWVIPKIEINTV